MIFQKPKKSKQIEIKTEEEPILIDNNESSLNVKDDPYISEPGEQNPLEIRAEDLNMAVTEENEEFETFYEEVFEITLPSTLWAIQRDPEKTFIVFSCFDEKCMGNIKTLFLDNKNNSRFYIRQKCVVEDKNDIYTTDHINSLLEDMDSYKVCAGIYSKDYNSCDGLGPANNAYCNSCREISFK